MSNLVDADRMSVLSETYADRMYAIHHIHPDRTTPMLSVSLADLEGVERIENLMMLAPIQANADLALKSLVENATLLQQSLPTPQAIETCKKIRLDINFLSHYTEIKINKFKSLVVKNTQELTNTEQQLVAIAEAVGINQTHLNDLHSKLQGLKSRDHDLDKDIQKLNGDIGELNNKIEREKTKRVDAATDVIPGVGLIGGLITGRYERMIPGYSLVLGLISTFTQEVEDHQRSLHAKQKEKEHLKAEEREVEAQIAHHNEMIQQTQNEMGRLRQEIQKKDQEIQEMGRHLTLLQNIYASLGTLLNKYQFLNIDLSLLQEYIENELTLDTKTGFLSNVQAIQVSFHAIEHEI